MAPNVELLRTWIEAYNARNMEAFVGSCDPGVARSGRTHTPHVAPLPLSVAAFVARRRRLRLNARRSVE